MWIINSILAAEEHNETRTCWNFINKLGLFSPCSTEAKLRWLVWRLKRLIYSLVTQVALKMKNTMFSECRQNSAITTQPNLEIDHFNSSTDLYAAECLKIYPGLDTSSPCHKWQQLGVIGCDIKLIKDTAMRKLTRVLSNHFIVCFPGTYVSVVQTTTFIPN